MALASLNKMALHGETKFMSHKPITISNISLYANPKICFENFSTQIHPGKHIVIMGINGSGKSTLLKTIQGLTPPTSGHVKIPEGITFGYVPQTITEYPHLSGGQRFNKALSGALSVGPDVLCLDEPTNHLDQHNKTSFIRMLRSWNYTMIIVSHDPDILALDFDEIWHIEHGTITIFAGNYAEYLAMHDAQQEQLEQQREQLYKEKRKLRKALEQEHKRAAQSKVANIHEKDRTLLGAMKESGSRSEGKNLKRLSYMQESIQAELGQAFVHKKIKPKFNVGMRTTVTHKAIVSIVNGSCGYKDKPPILHDINMQIQPTDRIAITGANGSGKSTFLKAILHEPQIKIQGNWHMPANNNIGYLDQHYSTLPPSLTIFQVIQEAAPQWSNLEVRKHLNDFLFSTQHEVENKVGNLSGGEKARLSLAFIAAKNPYLLLLDEITNNIDLQTREYLIEVLAAYPGALIIISHDQQFLKAISVNDIYEVKDGRILAAL